MARSAAAVTYGGGMGRLILILLAILVAFMVISLVISALHFLFWVALAVLVRRCHAADRRTKVARVTPSRRRPARARPYHATKASVTQGQGAGGGGDGLGRPWPG